MLTPCSRTPRRPSLGYFIKGALPHRAWRCRDVAEGTLYAGAIWSPGRPATQICPAHTQDVFKVVQTTSSSTQVHPSGEAIPYFQPSPPGTCATLGCPVLQRHRFIVGPACRPESIFRGALPRRVLASISSTVLHPMRHHHVQ